MAKSNRFFTCNNIGADSECFHLLKNYEANIRLKQKKV